MLTLEIGHVCIDLRVQCVDDHLAVGWTGNLNSAVNKTWCWWGGSPGSIISDVPGLWEEIWENPLVELGLSDNTALEKLLSSGVEGSVEEGDESNGILGEDLLVGVVDDTRDGDALDDGVDASHVV